MDPVTIFCPNKNCPARGGRRDRGGPGPAAAGYGGAPPFLRQVWVPTVGVCLHRQRGRQPRDGDGLLTGGRP